MENRSWTVTYRNRDNGQRITAAVFAADQRQAQERPGPLVRLTAARYGKSRASNRMRKRWCEFFLLNSARNQQGGHFACPRAGKMNDGRGERHPQRSEPKGHGLYL